MPAFVLPLLFVSGSVYFSAYRNRCHQHAFGFDLFRFGASTLVNDLLMQIVKTVDGNYQWPD